MQAGGGGRKGEGARRKPAMSMWMRAPACGPCHQQVRVPGLHFEPSGHTQSTNSLYAVVSRFARPRPPRNTH
eukprot:9347487-Alexandrium_andersonii.AAC.1